MGITINSSAVTLGELLTDDVDTVIPEASVTISTEESVAMLIERFGGIEEVRKDTYGSLHATCAASGSAAVAAKLLDDAELIFINNNFSEADRLKETTKSGKIKRTKFLPNDYMSAKSVLLSSMEQGIPLFDEDGNPLGKSALQDKKLGRTEKTPAMKLAETLARALKLAREVHGENVQSIQVLITGDVHPNAVEVVKA